MADSSELWAKLSALGLDPSALSAPKPEPVVLSRREQYALHLSDLSEDDLAALLVLIGLELHTRALGAAEPEPPACTSNLWVGGRVAGTCMLPAGHEGEHEYPA